MFKQMNKGFMNHIKGFDEWYKYQGILLITRTMFFWLMGTGVFIDASSNESIGAHAFMLAFLISVSYIKLPLFSWSLTNRQITFASRHSLKVDLSPLWSSTPTALPNVGPGVGSPDRAMGSLSDALDEIISTPSRVTRKVDPLGDIDESPPPGKPQTAPRRPFDKMSLDSSARQPLNGERLHQQAHLSSRPKSNTYMSQKESSHYLQTGELPSRLRRPDQDLAIRRDDDEMDWTPLNSEHRAFNPARSSERTGEGFSQAPVGDRGSQFWYKVPPAPRPTAHKLWNPALQPRLGITTPETKESFFNSMTSNVKHPGLQQSQVASKEKVNMEFAQPKFFPPDQPDESEVALENMLSSFSLGHDEPKHETPQKSRQKTEIVHLFQATLLGITLWIWNSALKDRSENSRNLLLISMLVSVAVAVRTMLENTLIVSQNKNRSIRSSFWICLSALEIGFAAVGIWNILAGYMYSAILGSLGNVLVGTMFVQEIWVASFPH